MVRLQVVKVGMIARLTRVLAILDATKTVSDSPVLEVVLFDCCHRPLVAIDRSISRVPVEWIMEFLTEGHFVADTAV